VTVGHPEWWNLWENDSGPKNIFSCIWWVRYPEAGFGLIGCRSLLASDSAGGRQRGFRIACEPFERLRALSWSNGQAPTDERRCLWHRELGLVYSNAPELGAGIYTVPALLDAAQREAGLKAAKKISPLRGGLISSTRLGAAQLDLGIWPKLLMDEGNVRRPAGVMLSVDILRIDW
jgi:hypothetical protein